MGILFSFLGLLLLLFEINPNSTGLSMALGLSLYGMGLGLIFSQITNLAMAGASASEEAEASGVFNAQKQLGMSLGTAFIGAVLVIGMINRISDAIYNSGYFPDATKEEIRRNVIDWIVRMKHGEIAVPPAYIPKIQEIANWALAGAMHYALMFMMFSLGIGAILSIWLPKDIDKRRDEIG